MVPAVALPTRRKGRSDVSIVFVKTTNCAPAGTVKQASGGVDKREWVDEGAA